VKLFQTSGRKEKDYPATDISKDEKQGLCTETLEATSSANKFVAIGGITLPRIGHAGLTLLEIIISFLQVESSL